ncbi:MAG: hypothetical protein HAW60_00705 [Bdellovibrionales bacterium]|nr:hypothetical protein [Bdellovibrionales bacterium]
MQKSTISDNLSEINFLKVSEVIGFSNCMVVAKQAYIVDANGHGLILRIFSQDLNKEWIKNNSLESLVSEDLSLFITDMSLDVEAQVLKIYQDRLPSKSTKALAENYYVDIKIELSSSLPDYWVECFSDVFAKKSAA